MSVLTPPIFRTSVTKPKIASPKGTKIKTISEFKLTCGMPFIKPVEAKKEEPKKAEFRQWYFRNQFAKQLYYQEKNKGNYSKQELTDKLENR